MNQKTQSLIFGLITIFCWGSLATFGNLLMHLPPFYVLGMAFLVGSVPAWSRPKEMFPSFKVTLWGVGGYFGYHFFLFYSFRFAPVIEVKLINYLWPIVIVILSPVFFPELKLKAYHILGASLAVIGSVVLVFGKGGELKFENAVGYLLALCAAIIWPLYSIGKKKMGAISVWAVGGFCFLSGILCLITHAILGPRVVLQGHDLWKIVLMGAGPFGAAFYCWDYALRVGDSRFMGALAYLTPVLSTLGLVLFTDQEMISTTFMAMILIIGGASMGLLDFLPPRR